MYTIYWLINEQRNKTYIGLSKNFKQRILEHKSKKVKTTINFGNFTYHILEKIDVITKARQREKYWKSSAGRRKLKNLYKNI